MVHEERQPSHGHDEELHAKRVVVTVIGGLELGIEEVDCGGRAGDEDDLHDGVVEGDEVGEEVQVPRDEHQSKHDLALSRQACKTNMNENINTYLVI